MVRAIYWIVAFDAILLAALAFVYRDLQWRVGYAESVHTACPAAGCSYSASFSFGFLTRLFTMSGNGVSLTSPPTLDWVQVIALLLVVVNGWYAFHYLRGKKRVVRAPVQGP